MHEYLERELCGEWNKGQLYHVQDGVDGGVRVLICACTFMDGHMEQVTKGSDFGLWRWLWVAVCLYDAEQ